MKRSYMKSSRPKMTAIRKAARGQECTINMPGVCCGNPETVVLCHSNKLEHGKGMGIKASDEFAAFGCIACHAVIDGRAPRPAGMSYEDADAYFMQGMEATREILREMGLLARVNEQMGIEK
jgi:hypothetical protein